MTSYYSFFYTWTHLGFKEPENRVRMCDWLQNLWSSMPMSPNLGSHDVLDWIICLGLEGGCFPVYYKMLHKVPTLCSPDPSDASTTPAPKRCENKKKLSPDFTKCPLVGNYLLILLVNSSSQKGKQWSPLKRSFKSSLEVFDGRVPNVTWEFLGAAV